MSILNARTLADQAFEWLEEAIIKGDIAPATKIDEVALAKALGISRGPLREAIRRLEGRKLVRRVPHVGARVVSPAPAELADILLVREALEGMACRLATERMTDGELDDLDALLDAHSKDGGLKGGESYYQRPGNYDFHYRIIRSSRSDKLVELLCGDLYHLLRIHRYRSSSRPGRALEAFQEHRAILAAMRRRDATEAEQRMREHISRARIATGESGASPPSSTGPVPDASAG